MLLTQATVMLLTQTTCHAADEVVVPLLIGHDCAVYTEYLLKKLK